MPTTATAWCSHSSAPRIEVDMAAEEPAGEKEAGETDEAGGASLWETIDYSCPWLLTPLCWAEINTQRTKVLANLVSIVEKLK